MSGSGRKPEPGGFTLVELVLSLTIMSLLAVALAGLLQASLQIQTEEDSRADLYRKGLLAMERLTAAVKKSTFVHVPNSHAKTRTILAVSGTVNDDNDYYFGDTDFPRIDEDSHHRLTEDGESGIKGIDDDGDGRVDEDSKDDDDEDDSNKEDVINGQDDDGDGNIDEDVKEDMNDDGKAGIRNMDDDGDGQVDEGDDKDDDEDGTKNEDPCNPWVYYLDTGTRKLRRYLAPDGAPVDVCTDVTGFSVTYKPPGFWNDPYLCITLTLTGADAKTVVLEEYVYPENILQRCGRRVK